MLYLLLKVAESHAEHEELNFNKHFFHNIITRDLIKFFKNVNIVNFT